VLFIIIKFGLVIPLTPIPNVPAQIIVISLDLVKGNKNHYNFALNEYGKNFK